MGNANEMKEADEKPSTLDLIGGPERVTRRVPDLRTEEGWERLIEDALRVHQRCREGIAFRRAIESGVRGSIFRAWANLARHSLTHMKASHRQIYDQVAKAEANAERNILVGEFDAQSANPDEDRRHCLVRAFGRWLEARYRRGGEWPREIHALDMNAELSVEFRNCYRTATVVGYFEQIGFRFPEVEPAMRLNRSVSRARDDRYRDEETFQTFADGFKAALAETMDHDPRRTNLDPLIVLVDVTNEFEDPLPTAKMIGWWRVLHALPAAERTHPNLKRLMTILGLDGWEMFHRLLRENSLAVCELEALLADPTLLTTRGEPAFVELMREWRESGYAYPLPAFIRLGGTAQAAFETIRANETARRAAMDRDVVLVVEENRPIRPPLHTRLLLPTVLALGRLTIEALTVAIYWGLLDPDGNGVPALGWRSRSELVLRIRKRMRSELDCSARDAVSQTDLALNFLAREGLLLEASKPDRLSFRMKNGHLITDACRRLIQATPP